LSRGDLTEAEWRVLKGLLPVEREAGKRGRGRPPQDNRNIINGILWRLRCGTAWRDVPEKYGNWNSIYRRFRRWSASGVDAVLDLSKLRAQLAPHYSHTGRPSIDPELMIRILLVGYCYGIRSERRLCEEVDLNLAYRWFCRLNLDDAVPDHSTFSKNRHGRFREADILRHVFETTVQTCMDAGLDCPRRNADGRRDRPDAIRTGAAARLELRPKSGRSHNGRS